MKAEIVAKVIDIRRQLEHIRIDLEAINDVVKNSQLALARMSLIQTIDHVRNSISNM